MDSFLQPKDSPCSPLEFRFKALFPCFTFQDPEAKKLPSELCNAPARKISKSSQNVTYWLEAFGLWLFSSVCVYVCV